MASTTTTVILGGGFGGIATARTLRAALPAEHRVVLVSKSRTFQVGATKTWIMLGEAEPEQVARPLERLTAHGIEFIESEVTRIDPTKLEVATGAGTIHADYLVIALGAELDMEIIPGLKESAETFYTRDGAIRLRSVLQRFTGGRIALVIPRIPFQCPPGPYEGAMLIQSHLEQRGLGGKTTIDIYTVEKQPMATAGPEIGKSVVAMLTERKIGFHPQSQIQHVDGAAKEVVLADGSRALYDLLIAIPPHTSPKAVRDSGLSNPSGWIAVHPQTLELKDSLATNRIYAIGDVASVPLPGRFMPDMPLVLPKAGVAAERQGIVVGTRIADLICGREPKEVFDGKLFCYIETGNKEAMRGDGSFFDMPHPSMSPRLPDTLQLAEKRQWVDDWMAKYL